MDALAIIAPAYADSSDDTVPDAKVPPTVSPTAPYVHESMGAQTHQTTAAGDTSVDEVGEAYCECCFRKVPATSIRNCWKKHCSAHQEPLTDCCACGAYLCQADHEEVGDVATHGNLMVQVMESSRAVLQQSNLPMSSGALAAGSDAVSSPSCYNNFVHGHPRQFT